MLKKIRNRPHKEIVEKDVMPMLTTNILNRFNNQKLTKNLINKLTSSKASVEDIYSTGLSEVKTAYSLNFKKYKQENKENNDLLTKNKDNLKAKKSIQTFIYSINLEITPVVKPKIIQFYDSEKNRFIYYKSYNEKELSFFENKLFTPVQKMVITN